jgi:hypothetical protein
MDFSAVDEKNAQLLEKYIRAYGFEDDDERFAISALRNPPIDDEFKKIVGGDFRKRWILDGKNQNMNDTGWAMFKKYFAHWERMGINYDAYKENKVIVGKNSVKIKKVMTEWYGHNFSTFLSDYKTEVGIPADFDSSDLGCKKNKDLIEKYIVKAFELIGTKKVPNAELELVLSCNFADWFLCSTAEGWTSCLNQDGGAYSMGLGSLIGDRNRAFMYICNGKRKNWHGIEVDSVESRSWVLLSKRNEKKIIKFYPNEFIGLSEVRKVTGDSSYTSQTSERESKNEVIAVKYKKAGVWGSIYNDGCGISKEKFLETGKIFWDYSRSRCYDIVSVPQKKTNESIEISVQRTMNSIHDYMIKGKKLNDDVRANTCPHCGRILSSRESTINVGSDRYCQTCAHEVLTKCSKCGNWEVKEDIKIYTIDGKPYRLCKQCADNTYLCANCGTRHFKDSSSSHSISGGRMVCSKCMSNVVKCCDCEEEYLKSDLVQHNGTLVCKKCFKKSKYRGWKMCSDCGKTYTEEKLSFDVKGNGTCDSCINALSRKNVKQIRFLFISHDVQQ